MLDDFSSAVRACCCVTPVVNHEPSAHHSIHNPVWLLGNYPARFQNPLPQTFQKIFPSTTEVCECGWPFNLSPSSKNTSFIVTRLADGIASQDDHILE